VAAPDVSPLGVLTLAASLISRLLGAAAEQRALSAQLAAERRIGAEAERLASIGSFVWEVDEDRLHWSDELHRIYGTTPEEFSGDLAGFTRRVHPDDRERVGAAILLALQKAGSFELEERIVRADGQTRILSTTGHVVTDGDGRPVEVFGACRDVTEHKALEEALAWTQHRFRVLLENSADVVAVIGRGGLMTYIAGRTDLMLGCRPDELVGTTGLRLVHLADVEHVYEAFLRVRETPGGSETVQYRLRHRTDSWRWVESVMVNLPQDEVLRGIVVNTRDVTDRRGGARPPEPP
jgi:PAS domain S-box-containing protein